MTNQASFQNHHPHNHHEQRVASFNQLFSSVEAGNFGRVFNKDALTKLKYLPTLYPKLTVEVLTTLLNTVKRSECSYLPYEMKVNASGVMVTDFSKEPQSLNRSLNHYFSDFTNDQCKAIDIRNISELWTKHPDIFITESSTSPFLKNQHDDKSTYTQEGKHWFRNACVAPAFLSAKASQDGCDNFHKLIDVLFQGCYEPTKVKENVLDWMAGVLFSNNPVNWHLMLGSQAKGIGKSMLVRLFYSMVHESNTVSMGDNVKDNHLTESLENKLIVRGDDVGEGLTIKERATFMNVLKNLLTESEIRINPKGSKVRNVKRHYGAFFTTNKITSTPLEAGDRRWYVIETRTDDTKLSNSLQGVNKVDFFSSVSKDINDPSKLKCFYEFLKARYESRKGYIDNLIHGNAPASTEKQILESLSKSSSAHSVEDALVTYSFGSQYGFGSSDCKNPFFLGCYSDIQSIPAFRDARKLPREMDTRISNTMVQAGYTELRLSHIVSSENNIGKLIGRSLSIWVNTGYLASVYKGNKCALQKDLLKDKGIVAHAKLAWAEHMMDISDKSDDHRMIRAMHKLKEECSKLTIGYKSPLGDNSNCGDEENNNQPIKPRAELEVELEVMRKRIAELESELTRTKHELDALKVKEVKAEVETQASVIEFPEYQQDQHSNCSQPVSSVDIAITVSHEVAVYELRRGHKLMSAVKKASNIVKSLKPRGLFFVDSIISQNDVEVATDINENGCYDAIDNLIDDLTDYRDRFSRDPRCSAIEYELITWLANTPIDLCPPDWDHF